MAQKETKKVYILFNFATKLIQFIHGTVSYRFVGIKQLQLEVAALEELSRQLFLEAHDIQNARERLEWAATWQGKYFNFLGLFFTAYCTWKILIVSVISYNLNKFFLVIHIALWFL